MNKRTPDYWVVYVTVTSDRRPNYWSITTARTYEQTRAGVSPTWVLGYFADKEDAGRWGKQWWDDGVHRDRDGWYQWRYISDAYTADRVYEEYLRRVSDE